MTVSTLRCVIALTAVALTGCAWPRPPKTVQAGNTTVAVADLVDVVPGLCAAAAASDPVAARASFYDRAHTGLHEIAQAVEPKDRPLAGAVLVAMQRVEAGLAVTGVALPKAGDIDALIDVTRTALRKLSVPAVTCPKGP